MREYKFRGKRIDNGELLEKLRKNNRMSGWTHIDRLIDEAAEAIEALQKENNGWQERYYELDAGHSRLFTDFCKLQKENEQLRAQVVRSEGCGYLNNAKCVKTTGMGVEYPKDDTF